MTRSIGDLNHRAITALYDSSLTVHSPRATPFGLTEQVIYLYGGWRESDGTLHVFERKFIGPMTAGLWLMKTADGSVEINPRSAQTVRGEVKRQYTDDAILLHGALMEKVGASGGDFTFRVTEGAFEWAENGDLLKLSGTLVGPGVQIYAPDNEEPILYISELYKTKGTVEGEEVEGFVFYDHSYWPAGHDWKEYRVYKDLQLGWQAFANEFEDGSIEWGHLCLGRNDFNFSAVSDTEGALSMEADVVGGVTLGEGDWTQRAVWQTPSGLEWTFELEENGALSGFTAARWGGYRAQAGLTRRTGDTRKVRNGFSWLETFGDRLRESKIPTAEEATDRA